VFKLRYGPTMIAFEAAAKDRRDSAAGPLYPKFRFPKGILSNVPFKRLVKCADLFMLCQIR
jgi:hypothetical protein